jgi:hypothetical protein
MLHQRKDGSKEKFSHLRLEFSLKQQAGIFQRPLAGTATISKRYR